ncbi:MAG TPA: M23 family metallopeptidase [Thermoanaerobaculia bacterium]
MEFQFHPASASSTVRTVPLSVAGQRILVIVSGAAALVAISLWLTVPLSLRRRESRGPAPRLAPAAEVERSDRAQIAAIGRILRERALDNGDLLNRIAFLYDVAFAVWPRILNPERPWLSSDDPEQIAAGFSLYLKGLEKARDVLEQRERADADLPGRVPAIFPFDGAIFEPSAFFGPRVSPWTGNEEFFPGVDLAAPGGSAVVASGGGTVVFAGTVRRSQTDWFWRLGNVVVVSHGAAGATVYGHLAHIEVKRGQQVTRGQRIGVVGSTGWAISPQLHYEYWRRSGSSLRPTDPMFAGLDRRAGQKLLSLEQMEASSAPGPLDPLPGVEISAEKVGAPERPAGSASGRAPKRRKHV